MPSTTAQSPELASYPVACPLMPAFSGEEVSLAENMFQAPMHPADQYEVFAKLHSEQGQWDTPMRDRAARALIRKGCFGFLRKKKDRQMLSPSGN